MVQKRNPKPEVKEDSSRRHSSRQHTNIIHKALYQILVLVRGITSHGQGPLAADFSSRDFDLELVLELVFRRWLSSRSED